MVERLAQAMLAAIDEDEVYVSAGDNLRSVVVDGRVDVLALARAALQALREPTEAMKKVGEDEAGMSIETDYDHEDEPCGSYLGYDAHTNIFRRMIDAALSEGAER